MVTQPRTETMDRPIRRAELHRPAGSHATRSRTVEGSEAASSSGERTVWVTSMRTVARFPSGAWVARE